MAEVVVAQFNVKFSTNMTMMFSSALIISNMTLFRLYIPLDITPNSNYSFPWKSEACTLTQGYLPTTSSTLANTFLYAPLAILYFAVLWSLQSYALTKHVLHQQNSFPQPFMMPPLMAPPQSRPQMLIENSDTTSSVNW